MNPNKITYESLTEYFRSNPPVPENPEELTQDVLTRIEKLTATRKSNRIIRLTGLLSGAAACLLFCLFIAETIRPNMSSYADTGKPVEPKVSAFAEVYKNQMHDTGPEEVREILSGIIKENKETRQRREQIYNSFLQKASEKNFSFNIK